MLRSCIDVRTGYFRILYLYYLANTARLAAACADAHIFHVDILIVIHRCTVTSTGTSSSCTGDITGTFYEDTVSLGIIRIRFFFFSDPDIFTGILIDIAADAADSLVTFDMGTGHLDILHRTIRNTNQPAGSLAVAIINNIGTIDGICSGSAHITAHGDIRDLSSGKSCQSADIISTASHINIVKVDPGQTSFHGTDTAHFRSGSGIYRNIREAKIRSISLEMSDKTNTAASIRRYIQRYLFKGKTIHISGNICEYRFACA